MAKAPLVLASTALIASLLASTRPARAGTEIALDLDGAGVLAGSEHLFSSAYGIGVRLGYEAHLPLLRFTPEVGYGYMRFSADRAPSDWRTSRVFVGARLGIGEILVPSAFAHVGYGWVNATSLDWYTGSGTVIDAGLALDIRIAIFGAGVHAAYNTIGTQPDTQQWISLGVHGEIVF